MILPSVPQQHNFWAKHAALSLGLYLAVYLPGVKDGAVRLFPSRGVSAKMEVHPLAGFHNIFAVVTAS